MYVVRIEHKKVCCPVGSRHLNVRMATRVKVWCWPLIANQCAIDENVSRVATHDLFR